MHGTIAGGCVFGVLLTTIALGDAAGVALGFKSGQVYVDMLVIVAVSWVYFVVVGFGHWYLYRVLGGGGSREDAQT